jgi:hypothetical protein
MSFHTCFFNGCIGAILWPNSTSTSFQRRMSSSWPGAPSRSPFRLAAVVVEIRRLLYVACRFVAFVSGSFVAVLLLFTIVDPDAFLHFDITQGRTVLFYLGVFTATLAVARGMVPEDHAVVNPEDLMRDIVEHTHYLPSEWRGKLHSSEVHAEFSRFYQLKVTTFLSEVASVVTTPFVLWYSLPPCAPAIIDFFREFTIHVDGLGFVCSFAVFDFQRHGDSRVRLLILLLHYCFHLGVLNLVGTGGTQFGAPIQGTETRWLSTQGKMEKSLLTFKSHHPDWMPQNETTSLYLSKMTDASALYQPQHTQQHNRHAGGGRVGRSGVVGGGARSSSTRFHNNNAQMTSSSSPVDSNDGGSLRGTPSGSRDRESGKSRRYYYDHRGGYQRNAANNGGGGGAGGSSSSRFRPSGPGASRRFALGPGGGGGGSGGGGGAVFEESIIAEESALGDGTYVSTLEPSERERAESTAATVTTEGGEENQSPGDGRGEGGGMEEGGAGGARREANVLGILAEAYDGGTNKRW